MDGSRLPRRHTLPLEDIFILTGLGPTDADCRWCSCVTAASLIPGEVARVTLLVPALLAWKVDHWRHSGQLTAWGGYRLMDSYHWPKGR